MKDAAQGVAEDLLVTCHRTWRRTWPSGPGCYAITTAAAVFVQLALRWGRNWAAQWHLARAVGKRFRGCRAKRLYVYSSTAAGAAASPGATTYGPAAERKRKMRRGLRRRRRRECGRHDQWTGAR